MWLEVEAVRKYKGAADLALRHLDYCQRDTLVQRSREDARSEFVNVDDINKEGFHLNSH